MTDRERPCKNTEHEIWRGKSRAEFGDPDRFYADSLFVPEGDVEALGINCGGMVIVKTIREWHRLAASARDGAMTDRERLLREALQELVDGLDWYAAKWGLGPARLQFALENGRKALAASVRDGALASTGEGMAGGPGAAVPSPLTSPEANDECGARCIAWADCGDKEWTHACQLPHGHDGPHKFPCKPKMAREEASPLTSPGQEIGLPGNQAAGEWSARAAFNKWYEDTYIDTEPYDEGMFEAFVAGAASVKPITGEMVGAVLDKGWLNDLLGDYYEKVADRLNAALQRGEK